MHCSIEVTESSTNKQHHLSLSLSHLGLGRFDMKTRRVVGEFHERSKHSLVCDGGLLDVKGLSAHERVDKFWCANGHAHAFQSRYIDDAKVGFSKIQVVEFTQTRSRGVIIVVPKHEFASAFSGDPWDVDFDFSQIETQFRVLSRVERGINVRIICESYPASTAVSGEDTTPDGVLRQAKSYLQPIPLLSTALEFHLQAAPVHHHMSVSLCP
jgi:hypothetical protein